MKKFYAAGGNVAALAGIVLCAIAGGGRLLGSFYVLGFEAGTLFLGGLALLVLACLAKLQLLIAKGEATS